MRHPVAGSRGGSQFVSEQQHARLLEAVFAVVGEVGYQGLAVRAVSMRAGVSGKTFYDLFEDREACFLAAFDHGVQQLAARVRPVYEDEADWVGAVRAALGTLLGVLDREPALRRLLFIEALAAGPRVLARRAEVLGQLAGVIDRGRGGARGAAGLSGVTAEGVVGAVFGVIHAQLLESMARGPVAERPAPGLLDLLGALMSVIVLPYRGHAAAARELARPAAVLPVEALATGDGGGLPVGVGRPLGSTPPVDFRLTVRTQAVLAAVGELGRWGPRPSNREVAERAGISDQGQISRLMMRLVEQGLVKDTGSGGPGAPKAWRLTPEGEAIVQANPLPRRHATAPPLNSDLRLTAPMHRILAAVSELAGEGGGPTNREVAQAAAIKSAGHASTLLTRLENNGLLVTLGGQIQGIPNAWQLTPRGEQLLTSTREHETTHTTNPTPRQTTTRQPNPAPSERYARGKR
jgi:AcrR family transcriptional regulator/DNA-binding PadR family transcriptional regulator